MERADGSPPSKIAKVSSAPIPELPDSLLAKIFAYLPLKGRHQLCFVSSAWAAASRVPWSDVTFLDLSTIPRTTAVDSILALCPMLQELCAKDVTINLEMKANLPISANLHTMKLRNVRFAVKTSRSVKQTTFIITELCRAFFNRFPKLTEFAWQDITCVHSADRITEACARNFDVSSDLFVRLPCVTAASIRRLTLICSEGATSKTTRVFITLQGMKHLECLYSFDTSFYLSPSLCTFDLPDLREVCLAGERLVTEPLVMALSRKELPKLEVVIIVASPTSMNHEQTSRLWQFCPALRIVDLAGSDRSRACDQFWDLTRELAKSRLSCVRQMSENDLLHSHLKYLAEANSPSTFDLRCQKTLEANFGQTANRGGF